MGTFLLTVEGSLSSFAGFSLFVGCILRRAFSTEDIEVLLKWPNDILTVGGQKLAGVLIELVHHAPCVTALVGIGVNLHSTPAGVENAIGLLDYCGKTIHPVDFAGLLIRELESALPIFLEGGFAKFHGEWTQGAFRLGASMVIDTGTRTVSGVFHGVDQSGALVIRNESGIEKVVAGHVLSIE